MVSYARLGAHDLEDRERTSPPLLSQRARLYLKPIISVCLTPKTNNPVVVEGVSYPCISGLRHFTRGLPNLKRYYYALGHYPGYYHPFPKGK